MARFKCDKCAKSFDTKQGAAVHHVRAHTNTWGTNANNWKKKSSGASKSTKSSDSGISGPTVRDKIRRVLKNHPGGLQVKDIVSNMKAIGYRPKGDATPYVSGAATRDPLITKVSRGIYRLTDSALKEFQPQQAPAPVAIVEPEPTIDDLPREALLVRINQLEKENRALAAGHMTFLREITSD